MAERTHGTGPVHEDAVDAPLSVLDLALGQGSPAEQAELRQRMAADPLVALAFAEQRQFLEALRELRVAPGPRWSSRLGDVVVRASKRQQQRLPSPRLLPRVAPWHLAAVAAAAAVLFASLALLDPLQLRQDLQAHGEPTPAACAQPGAIPGGAAVVDPTLPPVPEAPQLAETPPYWEPLETFPVGPQLQRAFERFARGGRTEALSGWLSPRNALAVMQIDFELRESAEQRRQALRRSGSLPDVDDRVQELARLLAAQLDGPRQGADDSAMAVAYAVRALLASGTVRATDAGLRAAARDLVARLPGLEGGPLASALAALAELSAVTGDFHADVEEHGRRLLADVVTVRGDTWTRRRPTLLSPTTPPAQVADAGRFLAIGSAFGLDSQDALLVRLLLAAHLQERRDQRSETPDLLAALCYGFADLLPDDERERIETRLRTWRPVHFVPDYVSLQQLAWSRSVDLPGFARSQLELRSVAALPTPATMLDRAALLLCLATTFASPGALGAIACGG